MDARVPPRVVWVRDRPPHGIHPPSDCAAGARTRPTTSFLRWTTASFSASFRAMAQSETKYVKPFDFVVQQWLESRPQPGYVAFGTSLAAGR